MEQSTKPVKSRREIEELNLVRYYLRDLGKHLSQETFWDTAEGTMSEHSFTDLSENWKELLGDDFEDLHGKDIAERFEEHRFAELERVFSQNG